jgi:hypothetical protein
MKADAPTISSEQDQARQRRREAIRLQEIEGNPFTQEDIEMFEMFDREGWSHEQRRAYIVSQIKR